MSKIKTIITTLALGLCTVSCGQLQIIGDLNLLDTTAKEDLNVCVGACIISSTLRWDPSGEKLAAFKESSMILDVILNSSDDLTRDAFKVQITDSLGRIFSDGITSIVVADIMEVYDTNTDKLNSNRQFIEIIEAVKSAIDSGILLSQNETRPVRVLPYKM